MKKIIFILIMTIGLTISADCDKKFNSCRQKCQESSDVGCMVKCYNEYNDCVRN